MSLELVKIEKVAVMDELPVARHSSPIRVIVDGDIYIKMQNCDGKTYTYYKLGVF